MSFFVGSRASESSELSRSVSSLDRDEEPLSTSSRTIPPIISEKVITTPREHDAVQTVVNEQVPQTTATQKTQSSQPPTQPSQLQYPQIAQKPQQPPPPLPPTKPVVADSTIQLHNADNTANLVDPAAMESSLVLAKEKSTQEKVSIAFLKNNFIQNIIKI